MIKPSALGDVVTALPVLQALRRTHPDAHIAWLVSETCAPLIAHDTRLDEAILFRRRLLGRAWRSPRAARELTTLLRTLHRGGFDWVLDLQGLQRSALFARVAGGEVRIGFADAREGAWLLYRQRIRPDVPHTVDRNIAMARQLGLDATAEDMRLEISDRGRGFAERLIRKDGLTGGFAACVPPTRWATKQYPTRHWRRVVEQIARDLPVVLLGSPGERHLTAPVAEGIRNVIDLGGKTSVDEMVGVIAASRGVFCCDSAAKFIAPAVGVDCVVLIGPTQIERTGPYLQGHPIIADVPCRGCLKRTCRHTTCMEMIRPEDVVAAARAMLQLAPDALQSPRRIRAGDHGTTA
jgi:ADP-heptose:LPS heptosyltransferase